MTRATLITCSFQGDLDLCRLLCESLDRHAGEDFEHRLYVPKRDLALFSDLATPRRRIETQESLLPRWLLKAPLPGPAWRARLRLPRRNVYLSPFHGLVRGWIAQQIMKIAATLRAPCEIVAHIDSDAALVAPLRLDALLRDGKARLYAGAVAERLESHALWSEAAGRLFGLPAGDYYQADYIDSVVVWRQSVVDAMTQQIAEVSGVGWARALAATPHFSEYTLYGVFAEHAVGLETAGLKRETQSLCLTRWTGGLDDAAAEAEFLAQARADQLLCCVQSTIPLPLDARRRIYGLAEAAIAALQTAPARQVA